MNYISTTQVAGRLHILGSLPRYLLPTPVGQAFVADAVRLGREIRCTCSRHPSSPLDVRRGNLSHLIRRQHTQHEHTPRCVHGDASRIAQHMGLPTGSITLNNGQIVLDFDHLFEDPSQASQGGGGEYQYTPPNLSQRMEALAHLLLGEAGWTSSQLAAPLSNPWWWHLQQAARSIRVSNAREAGTLENLLLLPAAVYGTSTRANVAKLMRAAQKNTPNGRPVVRRLLYAARVPASRAVRTIGNELDLSQTFGLSKFSISGHVLTRAWSVCSGAEKHHKAGLPVLAFGMATVRDRRPKGATSPRIHTKVEQLALIPLTSAFDSTLTEDGRAGVALDSQTRLPAGVQELLS